jgi:tetratricopeptide (TPR) repeat protein
MRNRIKRNIAMILMACGVLMSGLYVHAARKAIGERDVEGGAYAALKLLERGEELIEAGEVDRGVKMLETVIEQNPKSKVRFKAYLSLGRHYLKVRENTKAVEKLRLLVNLKAGAAELSGSDLDMYLEGIYLTGVAHFNARQYGAAFSALRKITANHPNTVWANQAYYYIGMSHFAQEHWSKAIHNLGLVGTFIDPESPEVEYVEAGHRFFVKINDGDLPILQRLGQDVKVIVEAKNGDKETILCGPQTGQEDIYVGSVRTEIGKGTAGDDVLHLVGGDSISVKYFDNSTKEGKKDELRQKQVKVASTGSLVFTRGTYKFKTDSAFLGQPVFLRVRDVDHDKTDGKDTISVRLSSSYKVKEEEEEMPTMTVDIDKLLAEEEEEKIAVRDELVLKLTEDSEHSGVFTGTTVIKRAADEKAADKADAVLSCAVGDTLAASYVDELTIRGEGATSVKDQLIVFDEIDSRPRADQDVVAEAITKAKKEIVEAEAYLEIARIFQSMGLKKGAKEKSEQGLDRVNFAIHTRAAIPPALRERAFNIKWNLYMAQDDFGRAMSTCHSFNRLYPESSLVDHALMGIGRIYLKKRDFKEAIQVFRQVAGMPNAQSRAEASFLAAETTERMHQGERSLETAVAAYKSCATRFPESEFAGPSLAKVVDYHIKTKDYAEADDLLTQIFLDYQDEDFLDRMLLKWIRVSFDMGDYKKAHEKCTQLLFEYPGSVHAKKAQEVLPRIEEKLDKKEG